jgi:hypothetical protein
MTRISLPLILAGVCLIGCSGVDKIDYSGLPWRASWQQPERVVRSLNIEPGDHVADIGAGEGYFLPYLAEAVGPEGKVYVVDVEQEIIDELNAAVAEANYRNVAVVLGEYDDPLLPTSPTFRPISTVPGASPSSTRMRSSRGS